MLIVSRKKQESIVISGDIEVIVLDVQGDRVKIGIDAPESVRVMRKELIETVSTNKAAVDAAPSDLLKLKVFLKDKKE